MGDTSSVKCCVPLCTQPRVSRTVSFYQFPEDENIKAEWIQVLKDMEMYGTIVKDKGTDDVSEWHICSRHFTSEDFEKLPVKIAQLKKLTSSPSQESLVKRYLCYDAVPSVFMKQTKNVGGLNKKVIIMKRKTGLSPRTSTSAGSPNAKKMKVKKDEEKPISRRELTPNNYKLLVASASPVVLNVPAKGTPTPQNTSEISAKMENIVNKMVLTKPLPSTSYRKAIPGVPDHDTSHSNKNMEEAVMSWLCLPQNIHAPYKPEPVRLPKTTPSGKVSNKQPERRSPRAVVAQPKRSFQTPPTTSLASVAQRLILSKSTPILPKNAQKGQKNTSRSITVTPTSQPKHKPPKVTVTNATKKPSKQNIQNAEPERKQPGTVQSMLTDAITKVFANPSSSKTGKFKARQCLKRTFTPQQISSVDGLLGDNLPLNFVKTQNNTANPGKSSNKTFRQPKDKRKGIKADDCDPSSSDSDESDNVEYVNGQVPWEAEDDASENYDNDNMEDEVPDENIDYDSYSNSIRLPTHGVLEMGTSNDDDGSIHHDPLALLKYEVIEEDDVDDVNDLSNEYSTPLLNGFAFSMTKEEDCTTILSAPAASSAVTAVPESANSSDDLVDAIEVKVEPVRIEYLSDDDNADSFGLVPDQIDGNNPGYSCAVSTVLTEGTATAEVKVKTEPMELLTS